MDMKLHQRLLHAHSRHDVQSSCVAVKREFHYFIISTWSVGKEKSEDE